MRIDFYSWKRLDCIWIRKKDWCFDIQSPLRKGCLGKRIHSKRIKDSILLLCDETKVK